MAHEEDKHGRLPLRAVGPVDLKRLLREIEALGDNHRQNTIRGKKAEVPGVSQLLEEFVSDNKVNLEDEADRDVATRFLKEMIEHAPTVHMSFAVDPSSVFIGKLLTWLRTNIHPHLLLTIGLEPTIAAGCILRTTNKQFDFSLREHFIKQRGRIAELLKTNNQKVETAREQVR